MAKNAHNKMDKKLRKLSSLPSEIACAALNTLYSYLNWIPFSLSIKACFPATDEAWGFTLHFVGKTDIIYKIRVCAQLGAEETWMGFLQRKITVGMQ